MEALLGLTTIISFTEKGSQEKQSFYYFILESYWTAPILI
jgi:hypothetical protein